MNENILFGVFLGFVGCIVLEFLAIYINMRIADKRDRKARRNMYADFKLPDFKFRVNEKEGERDGESL